MGKSASTKASSKKTASPSKSIRKSKTLKVAPKLVKAKSAFTKTVSLLRDQKDIFTLDQKYQQLGFSTRAIHSGNTPDQLHGGVVPSIELSTTYVQPSPGVPSSCYDYTRCGNPTVSALQRNLAAMENTKYAFALNSGMSATLSILSLLGDGDHLLCIDDVYGGTQRYLRKIWQPNFKMQFDMIDMSDLKKIRGAFKKNTKMVWCESPTNPTLKVTDIKEVAKLCHEMGALLIVDNTFMSPALQNPSDLGADVVMHSITKYIGGHSDVIAGALCFNDSKLWDRLFFNIKTMGTMISPFDAWIALKGSKTLGVRMQRAMENAQAVTEYLLKHPKVLKVLHPGHPSHPHHKIALKNRASKKLTGGSGMLAFYIKGDIKKTNKFLESLKVFTLAESLGGVESLVESPALMTHGSVPAEHRKMLGIDDNFVRFSVGIECIDDLINDLAQALRQI